MDWLPCDDIGHHLVRPLSNFTVEIMQGMILYVLEHRSQHLDLER